MAPYIHLDQPPPNIGRSIFECTKLVYAELFIVGVASPRPYRLAFFGATSILTCLLLDWLSPLGPTTSALILLQKFRREINKVIWRSKRPRFIGSDLPPLKSENTVIATVRLGCLRFPSTQNLRTRYISVGTEVGPCPVELKPLM